WGLLTAAHAGVSHAGSELRPTAAMTDQIRGGRMRRTGLCAFAVLFAGLLVAAFAATARAQTTTGVITGVVRDAAGGVMPGVTVKATHVATNAETTTISDDVGLYVLRGLPV